MDVKEYLEQIRRDLERQKQEIFRSRSGSSGPAEPRHTHENAGNPEKSGSGEEYAGPLYCPRCGRLLPEGGNFCPYCGAEKPVVAVSSSGPDKPEPLRRLIRDERLEETSKSRIGTFERLYTNTYLEETQVPFAFGFRDLDYAALVIDLASVLEIELSLSLYQWLRESYGVEMPRYANKRAPRKMIHVSGAEIDMGEASCMLGTLRLLMLSRTRELESVFAGAKDFIEELKPLIKIRNDAAHKDPVTQENFFDFYGRYSRLFNGYIGRLMDIKQRYRSEPGGRYGTGRFAGDAGDPAGRPSVPPDDEAYVAALAGGAKPRNGTKRGIIFTDTSKLAIKYFGYVNAKVRADGQDLVVPVAPKIREQVIGPYIEACARLGTYYELLDIADKEYRHILESDPSWLGYLKVLDAYCSDHGIGTDVPAGLFILGGHDVIPMPQIRNFAHMPNDEMMEVDVLERDLEADMLYCYNGEYVRLYADRSISMEHLLKGTPRFCVGRLPLEEGFIEKSVEEDLGGYFARAVAAYGPGKNGGGTSKGLGLEVRSPMVTTCRTARKVAEEIFEGIPVKKREPDPGLVENGMFVSPVLNLEKETAAETYRSAVAEADMLGFVLHGSHEPQSPFYFGEERGGGKKESPVAFRPDLFAKSNARVVAGICCWGARFIGYKRENSALLQAMYHRVLLFVGSSRTAFGVFDESLEREGGNGRIAWSESMMKLYLNNLLQGIDAGEALIRAKLDYFREYHRSDGFEDAAVTILEFNLFGDPLLHVCPLLERKRTDRLQPIVSPDLSDNRWMRSYRPVYSSRNEGKIPLFEEVRRLVDRNLEAIRNEIGEMLYKYYNVEPRALYTIHEYESRGGECGYVFRYREREAPFISDTIVNTDKTGKILNVLKTL